MARVLIIDDSRLARAMLKGMLTGLGHEVVGEADDVKPGIDAFRSLKPDMITLDLVMPGGSGLEVLKVVRAEGPATVVIVVTASGQEDMRAQVASLGARAVLAKPFTANDLKTVLGVAASIT